MFGSKSKYFAAKQSSNIINRIGTSNQAESNENISNIFQKKSAITSKLLRLWQLQGTGTEIWKCQFYWEANGLILRRWNENKCATSIAEILFDFFFPIHVYNNIWISDYITINFLLTTQRCCSGRSQNALGTYVCWHSRVT